MRRSFYKSYESLPSVLRRVALWSVALGMTPAFASAESAGYDEVVVFHEDFEGPFLAVKSTETADLSGTFPKASALRLDAGWATVAARFDPIGQSDRSNGTALRLRVESVNEGCVLLTVPGPLELDAELEYRLRFRLLGSGQTVRVNLRETYAAARPYRVLSGQTVTAANEWSRAEVNFPPATSEHGGQLELRFAELGEYVIDEVELVARRRDNAALRGALAGRNLLEASSQPVGFTAAWNFQSAVSVAEDFSGPTGVAPLRLTTPASKVGSDQHYFTGSVPTDLSGPFTLSFWARAAAPGHTGVQARLYPSHVKPWWVDPWVQTFRLTDQWQRFSHTVELPAAPEGFHIFQLVTAGPGPDVLIDGCMVEVGDTVSDFQRTGHVELGLANNQPLGVHFDDEPLAFSLAGWGDLDRCDLVVVRLIDALGRTHEQRVRLDQARRGVATAAVQRDLDAFAYGPIRIEAQALNANGESISKFEELIVHKVRRPRDQGQHLPDSPFGVHLWPNDDQSIDAAARLGFRWVRLFEGVDWPSVEPSPGAFRWTTIDDQLAQLELHGFGILAILGTTPAWAMPPDRGLEALNGYWARKAVPRDAGEYGEYVAKVAQRYAGRIHVYEPWNEPFWKRYFVDRVEDGQNIRGTPEQYAQLHRAAAGAIREHDPAARIAWNAGGAYDREDVIDFDRDIAELGVLDASVTDVVTFHDYSGVMSPAGFPGDLASTEHPQVLRSLLQNFNRAGVPLWDSESGFPPAVVKDNAYRHAVPHGRELSSLDNADQLLRVYVARLSAGVEKWFLYSFAAKTGFQPTYDLLGPDGHLPPFGSVLSNLFWHLEGKDFVEVADVLGGHAYLFADDTQLVAVLLPRQALTLDLATLPETLTVRDWFGNEPAASRASLQTPRPLFFTFSKTSHRTDWIAALAESITAQP